MISPDRTDRLDTLSGVAAEQRTMVGRRALVTGASGFIGSHLVQALASDGVVVRAFLRYDSRDSLGYLDELEPAVLSQVEVVRGDIRDGPTVLRAVEGCDTVFHLAALIAIPYSYVAPEAYVATNVSGTLNVLEASRQSGVKRVIHTSTSEVYGTAQMVPITEQHPIRPQSPYAASKAAADHLALAYHSSFGTPVVVLRPFNTFGPRQSLRAVIPTIGAQLLSGGPVHLGSLRPTRDFTFVSDTVAGFISAATAPDAIGRTLQLGTGVEISIGDLATLIAEIAGHPLRIEVDHARVRPAASEVERLVADPSLARKVLGWAARVSLRDGLGETVTWLRRSSLLRRAGEYVR
jgi:NAD dependent epimerase/dehydratase